LPVLETVLLAFSVFTLISIVWSTLVSGIAPMPSSKKARQAMLQMVGEIAEEANLGPIFELGSGWGNLLVPLAKQHPHLKVIGYELSIVPWLTTLMLKKLLRLKNIEVYRKNFSRADLTNAAIILCFLYPKGMHDLETQINAQGGQLKYLISNYFALPAQQPIKIIQLDDLYQSPIYLYKFRH
jgi:short subunit fatty acids transporter